MAYRPTDYILLMMCITIRIGEELPRCQHTQNRCPAKIIEQFYHAGVWLNSIVSEYFQLLYLIDSMYPVSLYSCTYVCAVCVVSLKAA